jgi:hypothetical protein
MHRGLHEITHLIEDSGLPAPVQQTSLQTFGKLAEAEAAVHGCPVEEVHFHEVRAADSILDIVGAAIGRHYFGIQAVVGVTDATRKIQTGQKIRVDGNSGFVIVLEE